jgi:hypothetical protein
LYGAIADHIGMRIARLADRHSGRFHDPASAVFWIKFRYRPLPTCQAIQPEPIKRARGPLDDRSILILAAGRRARSNPEYGTSASLRRPLRCCGAADFSNGPSGRQRMIDLFADCKI